MNKPNLADYNGDEVRFWAAYRAWQSRQVMLANQRSERIRRRVDCAVINVACLTQAERTALLGGAQ